MNFRELREHKRITPQHLAKLADVNSATIRQIERGEIRHPTYLTVSRLAFVLDVPADEVHKAILASADSAL